MGISAEDELYEMGFEDSIVFRDPDYVNAIIGYTDEGNVIYDYDLMVECLVKEDELSEIDAMEFIDYNTVRAIPYMPDPKPIIMHRFMENYKEIIDPDIDNTK